MSGDGEVFRTSERVRFAHCDPAGLMFYPRAFEFGNGVVEDWFAGPLGRPFARLHLQEGLGTPTVTISAEFHAPVRLGDRLDFALALEAMGGASVDVVIRASTSGEARFILRPRLVFVELGDRLRPRAVPDELRAAMLRFRAVET